MSVIFNTSPLVASTSQVYSMSTMFTITPGASNPTYLCLFADDLNRYTTASTGATGSFSGNGNTLQLASRNSSGSTDLREGAIVFQYSASTGQYLNATYGNLTNVTFTSSGSPNDVTDISYAVTNYNFGNTFNDSSSLEFYAQYGYLGSAGRMETATLVTTSATPVPPGGNATPQAIAAAAQSLVGQAWDQEGCWLLASTISALAGSSLPFGSLYVGGGMANGPWYLAYDGSTASSTDFQSLLRPGDVVSFITNAGNGHVTTVSQGYGQNAMLIDNANFGSNMIGGTDDLIIQGPHTQSGELQGVSAQHVTIFRLDVPNVVAAASSVALDSANSMALAAQFSATDPTGAAVTRYQIRTGNASDVIARNGVALSPSAGGSVTVSSLAGLQLLAQSTTGSHSVGVRAFNGRFWGDWTDSTVTPNVAGSITQPSPPSSAPVVAAPTPTPIVVTPTVTPTPGPVVATPAPATVVTPTIQATVPSNVSASSSTTYRFFDTLHGTQFLTSSAAERDALIATRPDLSYEGKGMGTVAPDPTDPNVAPVFRFFSKIDGTHFFTTNAAEKDATVATRSDLTFEGSPFSEHLTAQSGDVAVYRFFNTTNGSHFFTTSAAETASISATRRDMVNEGVAFYAPSPT